MCKSVVMSEELDPSFDRSYFRGAILDNLQDSLACTLLWTIGVLLIITWAVYQIYRNCSHITCHPWSIVLCSTYLCLTKADPSVLPWIPRGLIWLNRCHLSRKRYFRNRRNGVEELPNQN